MTTDPIAAARAMIEPLTGYTPGPWKSGRDLTIGPDGFGIAVIVAANTSGHGPADVRLIAAAPDLREMVATLADAMETVTAIREKVEAERDHLRSEAERLKQEAASYHDAYEQAKEGRDQALARLAAVIENTKTALAMGDAGYGIDYDIDAQATLDKRLAEARLEGWRAGLDAAARLVDGTAKYHMSDPDDIEAVRLTAAEIRALPEPKGDSHD